MPEKEITIEQFLNILAIFRSVDITKRNLFTVAVQKTGGKLKDASIKHEERMEDIEHLYCSKDKEENFLYYDVDIKDKEGKIIGTRITNKLKFNDEGRKKKREAIRKYFTEKINVPVHLVPDCPQAQELSISERNILAGIILDIEPFDIDSDKIPAWALEQESKINQLPPKAENN